MRGGSLRRDGSSWTTEDTRFVVSRTRGAQGGRHWRCRRTRGTDTMMVQGRTSTTRRRVDSRGALFLSFLPPVGAEMLLHHGASPSAWPTTASLSFDAVKPTGFTITEPTRVVGSDETSSRASESGSLARRRTSCDDAASSPGTLEAVVNNRGVVSVKRTDRAERTKHDILVCFVINTTLQSTHRLSFGLLRSVSVT
jgi:hypothetical protein